VVAIAPPAPVEIPVEAPAMPVLRFIEPCLPSPADRPPSGASWIHEVKHDGYRLMARSFRRHPAEMH
jgi:bifunctional non-homologous end joining protein LigD